MIWGKKNNIVAVLFRISVYMLMNISIMIKKDKVNNKSFNLLQKK